MNHCGIILGLLIYLTPFAIAQGNSSADSRIICYNCQNCPTVDEQTPTASGKYCVVIVSSSGPVIRLPVPSVCYESASIICCQQPLCNGPIDRLQLRRDCNSRLTLWLSKTHLLAWLLLLFYCLSLL